MDARSTYLLGGIVMLGAVWLILVPAAIISGRRRRAKEAREGVLSILLRETMPEPSSRGERLESSVTTWQGFSGEVRVRSTTNGAEGSSAP